MVTANENNGDAGTVHRVTGLFIAAVVYIACAGGAVHAADESDPVVSRPGDLVEFTRHCADEIRHRVQAYALFASPSKHTRALFQVEVGFAGHAQTIRVLAELQALALDAGAEWGEKSYELVLAAQNASGITVESPGVSTWTDHTGWRRHTAATSRSFATTADGRTRWLTFAEPDEASTDAGAEAFHYMDPMQITVGDLELRDQDEPIALSVIIRDLDSDDEIPMTGPSLRIPERMWTMKPPVSRVLTLAQSLNPFQAGGIPDWYFRGWKYRKCNDERKQAKELFGAIPPWQNTD